MKPDKGLRISKLAELAGVSPATIKHYLNEGLIPKPVKTGKTMAWYDPVCVERIKTVKMLQKEKYLPLDMIKRLIDSGADLESELEIGRILDRSDILSAHKGPFSEKEIIEETGLAREKIRHLENLNLVHPVKDKKERFYDAVDYRIIKLAHQREKAGHSFEYAARIMNVYADALRTAVAEDSRLFMGHQLGVVTTEKALAFLGAADALLDEFITIFRHKQQRTVARRTLKGINRLETLIDRINVLPVKGSFLPAVPPDDHIHLYHSFAGNFAVALKNVGTLAPSPRKTCMSAMLRLLCGDPISAMKDIEDATPSPGENQALNAAAALTFIAVAASAAGLESPAYLVKKAMAYLEQAPRNDVDGAFYQYIKGAIYAALPDVFGKRTEGERLLTDLAERPEPFFKIKKKLPDWMRSTVEEEIYMEIQDVIKRMLAE